MKCIICKKLHAYFLCDQFMFALLLFLLWPSNYFIQLIFLKENEVTCPVKMVVQYPEVL